MPHNILHCNVPIIKTPPDNFFNTQPDQQTKRTAWMICNLCATADCPLAALLREHEGVPLAGALPSRQTNAHSVFCCCVVCLVLLLSSYSRMNHMLVAYKTKFCKGLGWH